MILNEQSFYDILRRRAIASPHQPAIVYGSTVLTYGELLLRTERIASALCSAGLRAGGKVGLWGLPNSLWIPAFFGIIRAGGVAVLLNPNLTLQEAAPLAAFADCEQILFGPSHDLSGRPYEAVQIQQTFSLPAGRVLSLTDDSFPGSIVPIPDGAGQDAHADAFIIFTSGTTSFPKAVLLSQFSFVNEMENVARAIAPVRGTRAAAAAPLFHVYGLMAALMYLMDGGTIYLPARIKADVIAEMVERHRLTDIFSIALIYQKIADSPELTNMTAPSAKMCFLAGSFTTPAQLMHFEAAMPGAAFINLYGMTETSSGYCLTRPGDSPAHRFNTVGRPIDGVETAVWDETRGLLPPGETGEILTRGYHLKNGYYKLPPDSQGLDADGWFHSGDLGVFDKDGYLTIVGRIKDLIIKGGENIAPAEIEGTVTDLPGISACRVFGYRDPVYGENLAACITLDPGADFDEPALTRAVRERIGSYKTPQRFFVYDAFPMNANGKIDQNRLRGDMLQRLRRRDLSERLRDGITIASLSVRSAAFGIAPAASMAQNYALLLGFDRDAAAKIYGYAREILRRRIIETAGANADLHLSLLCREDGFYMVFSDTCRERVPDHDAYRRLLHGTHWLGDAESATLHFAWVEGFDPCAFLLAAEDGV